MTLSCRAIAAAWWLVLGPLALVGSPIARAQFAATSDELSDSINVDEAESAVRAHLERVRAYVADRQWDESVETLRQVMENHGSKVIPLTPTRYVNLTDYCHVVIASLPPEALALYRQRVDALAQNWYDEGLAERDPARLTDVVDKLFCSSAGDDALMALGEIELERGQLRRGPPRLGAAHRAAPGADRGRSLRSRPRRGRPAGRNGGPLGQVVRGRFGGDASALRAARRNHTRRRRPVSGRILESAAAIR